MGDEREAGDHGMRYTFGVLGWFTIALRRTMLVLVLSLFSGGKDRSLANMHILGELAWRP